MFVVRCWAVCAAAILATRDARAIKDTMVCVESSVFYGEECTVIGDRGGGTDVDTIPTSVIEPGPDKTTGGGNSSSTSHAHADEPDSRTDPCNSCRQNRYRALKISREVHSECIETEIARAMHACSEAGAYPVVGNLDGLNRSVRPMRDGMLCCDKSKDTEAALQDAEQINPSVEDCGLVPVGYTGRVCLVGTVEKWWADTFGHDACPYTRILNCQAGYLIDPDDCFRSHTVGAPGTTRATTSTTGVEVDGVGPAKFTGGSSESNSTSWGQTGGSIGTCRDRARKRNDEAEESYSQCMRTHDCVSERNNSYHPSM